MLTAAGREEMPVSCWGLGQVAKWDKRPNKRGVWEKGKSARAKLGSEDGKLMTYVSLHRALNLRNPA